MNTEQQQRLTGLISQPVEWQGNLSRYTSFAIGGPAEAIVTVAQTRELQPLLRFLAEENISWRVLGKGTNVLVRDEGFPGVIIRLAGEFTQFSVDNRPDGLVAVRAGGGGGFAILCRRCSEAGLSGLEFACGIPGTVGAAVIMNAGAWGSDVASVVHKVTLETADALIDLSAADLNFDYRSCRTFSAYLGRAVITAVELILSRGEKEAILSYCSELLERRKLTQPNEYANAGSFFKNPPGDSAGRLIDASGLKGMSVGAAMVSERHGNFFVNTGGASCSDVLRLMQLVQDKVKNDWGISLEPEVHFL